MKGLYIRTDADYHQGAKQIYCFPKKIQKKQRHPPLIQQRNQSEGRINALLQSAHLYRYIRF